MSGLREPLDSSYAAAFSDLAFRYFMRAGAHGLGSQWTDSALVVVRQALQLDPESPTAFDHLGLALADQGRLTEARTAYQQALAVEVTSHTALNLCISVEIYTGRLPDAAYWCRIAALSNPLDPVEWFALTAVELTLGRLAEAREYAARGELLGGTPWLWYFAPFFAGPDAPEAEAAVARLEESDPRGGIALGARALLEYLQRDTVAFLAAAHRYQDFHPEGYDRMLGPAPHLLGTALALAGRTEEARPLLEQGLGITSQLVRSGYENPIPAVHAAQALALLGRQAEAAEWLDRAYEWNLGEGCVFPAVMRIPGDGGLAAPGREEFNGHRCCVARGGCCEPKPGKRLIPAQSSSCVRLEQWQPMGVRRRIRRLGGK